MYIINFSSITFDIVNKFVFRNFLHVEFPPYCTFDRDTRRRSWLSQCATSRKLAGSIPDGFTAIFH
jgi:hypothetical protein